MLVDVHRFACGHSRSSSLLSTSSTRILSTTIAATTSTTTKTGSNAGSSNSNSNSTASASSRCKLLIFF